MRPDATVPIVTRRESRFMEERFEVNAEDVELESATFKESAKHPCMLKRLDHVQILNREPHLILAMLCWLPCDPCDTTR